MKDVYNNAALRGCGVYNNAALKGCGSCDCGSGSYSSAALRGMGRIKKLKKGSPEAKAFMSRLRAMRGKGRAGKKMKGGIALTTIATAIGMIPTAIKGAQAIYNGIKWLTNKAKGGRALITDSGRRSDYIQSLKENFSGRKLAALWPYSPTKAQVHLKQRIARTPKSIRAYMEEHMVDPDDVYMDTATMRKKFKEMRGDINSTKPAKVKKARKKSTKDLEKEAIETMASLGLNKDPFV